MTMVSGSGVGTLGLALAAQTTVMLPVFLLGSLSPLIMADLGIDAFGIGLGVAGFYAASAAGSALLAPLADRTDAWRVSGACLLAAAGVGCAIALFGNAAVVVFVGLVVAGLTNGVIQPATNVVVSRYVPPARQGLAFGIKQSSIPLATMLGGFAVPAVGTTLGWRWAFAIAAFLALCVVLMLPRGGTAAAEAQSARAMMRRSTLLLLALMSGLGAGSANAMAAFLVPSIVAAGHSAESAGIVLATGSVVSIAVRLATGHAADRGMIQLMPGVAILFAGGALAYGVLASTTTLPAIVLGALLAFGMGWGWSAISVLAIVRASLGAAGSATGITQAGVFSGAVLGPLAFGWMAADLSYSVAWVAMAVVTLGAAICALFAGRLLSLHAASKVSP